MTEEVTDARIYIDEARRLHVEGVASTAELRRAYTRIAALEADLAMRSASNSPTTNGEAARIPAPAPDVERDPLASAKRQVQSSRDALNGAIESMIEAEVERMAFVDDCRDQLRRAGLTQRAASDDEVERPYGAAWAKFAAPGDQQEDVWILRFCDQDMREAVFTGPSAEKEAWESWERYAPAWNCYLFRLAALSTPTKAIAVDDPETAKGGE